MDKLKEQIQSAVNVYKSGNLSKAEKLCGKLIKENPKVAFLYNLLGLIFAGQKKESEAIEYYNKGLKIDPKHIGINEYLGELYVATNRHNLAVERLEVLKDCNCKEYDQLKAVIAGEKSKY